MKTNNLNERIGYYAINKPYMVGLNKLLPIPQAESRWTNEQKEILQEVNEIEDCLKTEKIEISISTYLKLLKKYLNDKGIKTEVSTYLVDVDERKDEKQFLHVYKTYKYYLNYINGDQTSKKAILTNIEIDEPVPYLNGTSRKLKLVNFLQDEDVQKIIKEYPDFVDQIVIHINNEKLKVLNEERRVLDEEFIALSKKSKELDDEIDKIKDEIYAINNKKEISLINKSINKFIDTKTTNVENETEVTLNEENNQNHEF